MIVRVTKRRNRFNKMRNREKNLQERAMVNAARSHNPREAPNWKSPNNQHSRGQYTPKDNKDMSFYDAAFTGALRTANRAVA